MASDWTAYLGFDWASADQQTMDPATQAAIEALAAGLLEVDPAVRDDPGRPWAAASPPGRYAATVLQVAAKVARGYRQQAEEMGIASLGVKIFKTTRDAQREGTRLHSFYAHQLRHLPGLPSPHVQRVLAAGKALDGRGEERFWIIQEWVAGMTLGELRPGRGDPPIAVQVALSVIDQLLGRIVIPLWSEGLIWWDFRDANYCYDRATERLMLIDVDSLAAYSDEILGTPVCWDRRDKGRQTALGRLRQMCLRLLRAADALPGSRGERRWKALWEETLHTQMLSLGREVSSVDGRDQALAALREVLGELRCELGERV